jgi:hypothetical protein
MAKRALSALAITSGLRWLQQHWIGFHKDATIKRNELERQTVLATGARLFCIPRADLVAEDLAERFIANIGAIQRAAESPGPLIYSVPPTRIDRLL